MKAWCRNAVRVHRVSGVLGRPGTTGRCEQTLVCSVVPAAIGVGIFAWRIHQRRLLLLLIELSEKMWIIFWWSTNVERSVSSCTGISTRNGLTNDADGGAADATICRFSCKITQSERRVKQKDCVRNLKFEKKVVFDIYIMQSILIASVRHTRKI